MKYELTLPIATRSEANASQREYWATKHRRAKSQRGTARMFVQARRSGWRGVPVRVTLTRLGPRLLDDDNLRGALKHVRDGIADGLGLTDDSARSGVTWDYGQEKRAGTLDVRVVIETTEALVK